MRNHFKWKLQTHENHFSLEQNGSKGFSLSLFHAICPIHALREYPEPSADHDPSPNTGDHKGVIFQSWPCPPPAEGVRLRFKGRWETSEAQFPLYPPPCRLPPQGQPFEGVITAACITWVTADGGWSQLMKPLKQSPLSWFLLKFWKAGPRPGSQTITDVALGGLWGRGGLHFDMRWVEGAPSPCLTPILLGALQTYTTAFSSPSKKKMKPPSPF